MTMYNITEEQLRINALLEENGGELTDEIAELLTINQDNLNQKIESYCMAIKTIESKALFAKTEIERLKKIAATYDNSVKRMKEAMLNAFNVLHLDKVEVGTFKVSTRKSKAVMISDDAKIDDRFYVIKKEISKTLIKEALDKGESIAGATMQENQSIQIR